MLSPSRFSKFECCPISQVWLQKRTVKIPQPTLQGLGFAAGSLGFRLAFLEDTNLESPPSENTPHTIWGESNPPHIDYTPYTVRNYPETQRCPPDHHAGLGGPNHGLLQK
jgi:hypothetical protein